MTSSEQKECVENIASHHNDEGRAHNYNWIRTCVTILTPSLALLIGLQGTGLAGSCVLRYLLVSAISLMTIAVLLGLVALRSEAKAHVLARDEVIQEWNENQDFQSIQSMRVTLPKRYQMALYYFPFAFWLSILSLGVFGIAKYII